MEEPQFRLIEGKSRYLRDLTLYVIYSSRDLVFTIRADRVIEVLKVLKDRRGQGFVATTSLMHFAESNAETEVLKLKEDSPVINHGYFESLESIKEYLEVVFLIDV